MAPIETVDKPGNAVAPTSFTLLKQSIDLDVHFSPRVIKGRTILDIEPHSPLLKHVHLNCRQLKPTSVTVEDRNASFRYSDLYERLTLYPGTDLGQHQFPKARIERHADGAEDELLVTLPDTVRIKESRQDGITSNGAGLGTGEISYDPIKVVIEYTLKDFRDGIHFTGVDDSDARYPHVYTRGSSFPGTASCWFPTVDDGSTKIVFDLSIKYPRTLGDAFSTGRPLSNGLTNGYSAGDSAVGSDGDDEEASDYTEEEKALEMAVICSGELTDDITDTEDPTRKTASFEIDSSILAENVGLAIGPFTHVDLSEYRDTQDDERLGSNAIRVHAFCLPGKEDEVRNSAMMLARTLDSFTERYQSYPYGKAYKLAFVDDLDRDVAHTASFSICSSRLLFPETVWEPLVDTTRILVHAVASQWIGVNVVPLRPSDRWIIAGGSWFMTELYLRELFGRNDHRFRQKQMADKVIRMDHKRPSLLILGDMVDIDPGEEEFMELKSLSVLSILHNRLVKQSGKNGVDRCLYRLLLNARNEKLPNGAIDTEAFRDICEKVGHQKLDAFFNQWVYGSGCPSFQVYPSFNKKKQVINLTIRQIQAESALGPEINPLAATDFVREAKEKKKGFRHSSDLTAFVGPMTVRIHEADGTPYEHIVDINSSHVKVEIQYNTKYKRLKRNKLARERAAAQQGLDATGDQEDVTFYSLGDLFQSPEEIEDWQLSDWSPEDEAKMEQESYEWIRIDADFEWIAATHISDMPSYMYVSQLQQDKDVVAQAETIQYLATKQGHPLISSILIKTLMDSRYFHGIRTMAADVLANCANCATQKVDSLGFYHLTKAFEVLFCLPRTDETQGTPMTRSNDFSDRALYLIQKAIPKAISKIKGPVGRAPRRVREFLLDIIRYNDNRGNDYSDDFYLATLMSALTESLRTTKVTDPTLDLDAEGELFVFTQKAMDELSRHQRLDEWIPTYQNIYTITALRCGLMLMLNKIIPFVPSEFLQYTRAGNAENVRLEAWTCLVELGMIKRENILRYMIYEISSDPSPHFRAGLLRLFELALGHLAIGDLPVLDKVAEPANRGLVIEQEEGPTDRESELKRRKLDGAIAALKVEVANDTTLRQCLQSALRSQVTSVRDVLDFLEICALLYRQENHLIINLKYPRFWRTRHIGNGKLVFTPSERIRTTPRVSLIEHPKTQKILIRKPTLKISAPAPTLPPATVPAAVPPTPTPVAAPVPAAVPSSVPEPAPPAASTPALAPLAATMLPIPVPAVTPPATQPSPPTIAAESQTIASLQSAPVVHVEKPKAKPKKTQTPASERPKKQKEPKGLVRLKYQNIERFSFALSDEQTYARKNKRKAEEGLADEPALKRQATADEIDDMPLMKRSSTERSGTPLNGERGLMRTASTDLQVNGGKPRLIVKLRIGKANLARRIGAEQKF